MPDLDWLSGDDDNSDRAELKLRLSVELKSQLESIAEVETRMRQLRKKTGQQSVNRLAETVLKRFVAGWAASYGGILPLEVVDRSARKLKLTEKSRAEVDRKARAVVELRQSEERAKAAKK